MCGVERELLSVSQASTVDARALWITAKNLFYGSIIPQVIQPFFYWQRLGVEPWLYYGLFWQQLNMQK